MRLLGLVPEQALVDLVDLIAQGEPGELLRRIDALAESGQDMHGLLDSLLGHLRLIYLLQHAETLPDSEAAAPDRIAELRARRARCRPRETLRTIDLLAVALRDIRDGSDARLPLEVALITAARPAASAAPGRAAGARRAARARARGRRAQPLPAPRCRAAPAPARAGCRPCRRVPRAGAGHAAPAPPAARAASPRRALTPTSAPAAVPSRAARAEPSAARAGRAAAPAAPPPARRSRARRLSRRAAGRARRSHAAAPELATVSAGWSEALGHLTRARARHPLGLAADGRRGLERRRRGLGAAALELASATASSSPTRSRRRSRCGCSRASPPSRRRGGAAPVPADGDGTISEVELLDQLRRRLDATEEAG